MLLISQIHPNYIVLGALDLVEVDVFTPRTLADPAQFVQI
jgi:hypothetical protein